MTESSQLSKLISKGYYESITHFLVQYFTRKLFPERIKFPLRKLTFSIFLAFSFGLLFLFGLAGNCIFGLISVTPPVLPIFLLGIVYIYVLCIVIEFQIAKFLTAIREYLVHALVDEQDQQSLYQSMNKIFSFRRQFWFGIIFSLLAHIAFIAVDPSLIYKFGLGFLVVNVIFHTFHGFCVYFYFAYFEWTLSGLRNYHYHLFDLDPSNTEIIYKVAKLLQSTTYLMTFMVASATIIFSSTNELPLLSIGTMIIIMWISTIALYFINHQTLKSIISSAKWEKLNTIQTHIRELYIAETIPNKDTLEHIKKLKEYHDKIRDSPDSPWGFIKFVNTLNTLVWPTIGIVSANLKNFLDLVQKISG